MVRRRLLRSPREQVGHGPGVTTHRGNVERGPPALRAAIHSRRRRPQNDIEEFRLSPSCGVVDGEVPSQVHGSSVDFGPASKKLPRDGDARRIVGLATRRLRQAERGERRRPVVIDLFHVCARVQQQADRLRLQVGGRGVQSALPPAEREV